MKLWLLPLVSRIGTRTLATICGLLFVVDLIVPDPIPLVDELLLGLTTLLLARRRSR